MKKINWKDIGVRCLKTFIQAFLSTLAITIPTIEKLDKKLIISILIGAGASGISACMNFISNLLKGDEIDG